MPAGSVQLGSPALMKLVWERVVALEFCSPLGFMWCRSSCFEGNLFHGNQTGCCWNSRLMSQCNILAHCDPQGCESQTRLCTFLSRVNVLMCKKILRGTIRLSHFAINRVLKCEVGRVTAVSSWKDSSTGEKWFFKAGDSASNPKSTGLFSWGCVTGTVYLKFSFVCGVPVMTSVHTVRCSQKPTRDQYSAAV